jgi:hypothetical protein
MPKFQPLIERFCSRLHFDLTTGCWEWKGYVGPNGYGSIMVKYPDGRFMPNTAHRVGYELLVGSIPDGMTLDHLCRNRKCANPFHLEICTQQVNILRGTGFSARNAKRMHCPKGHPYEGYNLVIGKQKIKGSDRTTAQRQCRLCINERARKMWHARVARRGYGKIRHERLPKK